jgi:predicted Zn-dependent peptidase
MNRLLSLSVVLLFGASCAHQASVPATPPIISSDWRSKRPLPGPEPTIHLPHFEKAQLANGFTVLVNSRRDLPLVTVLVAFAAGSAADPQGAPGLADVTYNTMLFYDGTQDTQDVTEVFADLGTTPMLSVSEDGATMGAHLLSRNLTPAVELLAEVTRNPFLKAKDFDRVKRERESDLVLHQADNRAVAEEALDAAVYGKAHPYGHPSQGYADTVAKLKWADAKAYYKRWVGPRTTALVLTGDVSLKEATALAERLFGDWKGNAIRPPKPVAPTVDPRQHVLLLPRPGLEQTVLVVGRAGVAEGDPDQQPLELVLNALAGNFGSRLNLDLREDKAISYGTAANINSHRSAGTWTLDAAVQASATGVGMQETMREIEGLKTHPIGQEELERARSSMIQSLPASFETTNVSAYILSTLFCEDLPLDHLDRGLASLREVTPEKLDAVVDRYLKASQLQLVVAGDPEVVKTQLTPLKLGPIETLAQPQSKHTAP